MLIDSLRAHEPSVSQVWLADDATAAGKISSLKEWYDHLIKEGKEIGYLVNRSKSWLIVKDEEMKRKVLKEFGTSVNVTTEGQRHLGAVIGSSNYKEKYCRTKVTKWQEDFINFLHPLTKH